MKIVNIGSALDKFEILCVPGILGEVTNMSRKAKVLGSNLTVPVIGSNGKKLAAYFCLLTLFSLVATS